LNTERDTREETIINQDVATLLPIITQGMRGADDLTNYVYAITNYWTLYNANGTTNGGGINGYTFTSASASAIYSTSPITNGANIVGILSTPEFVADIPNNYPVFPGVFNTGNFSVYSNHIVAYVRSMSGSAAEKPPQNNDIVVGDSFTYRIVIVNAPIALDTNTYNTPYNKQIWQNQRELRMTYYWPLLPNGNVGNNRQTFRATVAGQLSATNLFVNQPFYFYQPQSFGLNTNSL
jgi:hypothetical protein